MASHAYAQALSSNAAWSSKILEEHPTLLPTLAAGQSPAILWLGCSDSRCPETTLLGLKPGDVFVHRNIANIISPTDINSSAVVEYAVAHLKVKHVVLCGHSSCGGAAAALGDGKVGGVLDTWLMPLKLVRQKNRAELDGIADMGLRIIRLAELNVKQGVDTLMLNAVVAEAVKEGRLQVHGCIFDIAAGKIRDLGIGTES